MAPDDLVVDAHRAPIFLQLSGASTGGAREELNAGLAAPAASISPKYFYDVLGSRLFEAICALPEYYPTRTEAAILETHGAAIARNAGTGRTLIDLGAGSCEKAERLMKLLRPSQYVPIDISADFLRESVDRVHGRFPDIEIVGLGQDFTQRLLLPPPVRRDARLFFFPGSSIGNFAPAEALAFLKRLRAASGDEGMIVIGVDLVKDLRTLTHAYDDALGVTAAFNLNVLRHVNALIDSDFDIGDWQHVALFSREESRIEMHLEARRAVDVRLPAGTRRFACGERIHTENSYKYTVDGFAHLLELAGFQTPEAFTDDNGWFAVFLASA